MNTNLLLLADTVVEPVLQIKVAYVGLNDTGIYNEIAQYFYSEQFTNPSALDKKLHETQFLDFPEVLVIELDSEGQGFLFIEKIRKEPALNGLIIIAIALTENAVYKAKAVSLKVHDYYALPIHAPDLKNRIQFLVKFRIVKPLVQEGRLTNKLKNLKYKMPIEKRIFDICLAAAALFILSPIYIIVALMIRLESKGTIIYKSKRVGTGYKIFTFYKFRSMEMHADKYLGQLSYSNQYNSDARQNEAVYVKIADDPRVTKVGRFLRNTSLDELPQLYNILKGDMSFVGNRPLPLYEAELLTSNEWSMRFLSPAGLTGLWQVSKRGKKNMSELERKELDNFYARKYSFWLDIKILLNTIPAILQQEKV